MVLRASLAVRRRCLLISALGLVEVDRKALSNVAPQQRFISTQCL